MVKREIKIPNFPLIILYANDWNLYKNEESLDTKFQISKGWIAGFFIEENEEAYVIAAEYFDEEKQVRYTQAIPKETVLFKKIINLEK